MVRWIALAERFPKSHETDEDNMVWGCISIDGMGNEEGFGLYFTHELNNPDCEIGYWRPYYD